MDSSGHNPTRRDRIPIPLWNRIVRTTEQTEQMAHGASADVSFSARAPNIVLAKNTIGDELGRHEIVAFSGIQTDPSTSDAALKAFKERPILTARKFQDGDVAWGVAIDAIRPNDIGRIAVLGCVPVQIDVSDEDHQYAKPKIDEVAELESCGAAEGAATVMWKDTGTGVQWAIVRLGGGGGASLRLCKTSAEFPKGGVQTLNVWEDGDPPNETQSTDETVEDVVNKYATIATGKWVSVALHGNGRWYVVAAECSEA